MKLLLSVLGSGSKGNSIYIETDRVSLLIDAGFSAKQISERLKVNGFSLDKVRALFLTHEHSDHVKGVGPLYRKYGIDIYATRGSLPEKEADKLKDVRFLEPGKGIKLENVKILPFSIPHDANNPVGYRVEVEDKAVAIATDFGHPTPLIKERLKDADVLIIEANHNEKMLREGRYPWDLKQRIKSNFGHISNRVCGEVLLEILGDKTKKVFLSHISEENNTYKQAYLEVGKKLLQRFSPKKVKGFLSLAFQDKPTVPIEI